MNGNLKGIGYRVQGAGTSMVNRVLDKLISIGLFAYTELTKIEIILLFIRIPQKNTGLPFVLRPSTFSSSFVLLSSNFKSYLCSPFLNHDCEVP